MTVAIELFLLVAAELAIPVEPGVGEVFEVGGGEAAFVLAGGDELPFPLSVPPPAPLLACVVPVPDLP